MAKVTQLLSAHSASLETEEEKTGVGERCFQNCKEYIGVGKNLNTIQSIFLYRYGNQGPEKDTDRLKVTEKRA